MTELLLLLSVWLCATPWMAAHQAPPSLGFSRKNTGVGCHFLLQIMKVKSESEVAQSCMTPSDSMDCGLPGSSVHGIFQARVLEWVAIQAHIYTKNTCVWYSYLPISIHWQILGTWRVHFPLQSGLQLSGPQKNVSTLYKNDPRFLQSVSSPHEYPGCLRETSLCFPHLRKLNVWNAQLSIFLSWKSKLSQRDDSQVSRCAPTLWPTILVLSEGL